MVDYKIKHEANELRQQLGYTDNEPIRFKSLLLKENIVTYFTPLDDDFSGMAIKANNKAFILANSNHSLGRQHFTISHELYHLFVDENFKSHKCQTAKFDSKDKGEYIADKFASYFLLPENGVLEMIPEQEMKKDKISLATIIRIEQYYACSRTALANRLFFMGLLSKKARDSVCVYVKKSAQLHGYSLKLYEPGNEGELWGNYGELARRLFDNEQISEGHYGSLLADIGIDIFKDFDDNGY